MAENPGRAKIRRAISALFVKHPPHEGRITAPEVPLTRTGAKHGSARVKRTTPEQDPHDAS